MSFSASQTTGPGESAGEPTSAAARSRAETRRRLIEAGTELFARDGLHGTTSTQIARAAGVAAGTFYLHFPDKQALFRAIAFDALGRLRERMALGREHVSGDVEAVVRANMETLVAFADQERDLVRIVFGRGHEAGSLADEIADALFPGVEARLLDRQGEGRADPGLHAAVAAQALLAMWTHVLAWWVEDPSRAPRDSVVETLVRMHPIYTYQRAR
jgi:AcrR family transcriptional regulator